MRELLRPILPPVTSLLVILLGVSFFNTFVSVKIASDGWNNFVTGLLYSAYYAGMMTGALYIERAIRRTGHIRGFSIFAALTATAVMCQSFTTNPYAWLISRFITGLSCAGLFIVIESWLLLLSSPSTRGVVLSIYSMTVYAAQSFGQFILVSVDVNSYVPFSIAVIFSCLSIIPVCLMRAAAPSLQESEYINIFQLFKRIPLGFIGNFISGMILSSIYALGPVFGKEIHLSIWQISMIMFTTIFGGMALQWPIGYLSDLIERRKVIVYCALILTLLSLFLFLYTPMPYGLLLVTLFFYGGFAFTIYPISITYCSDFVQAKGLTSIICAALIIYGIGCIFGPMTAPLLMESTSPSGLFLHSAVLAAFLTIFALFTSKPKEHIHKDPYHIISNLTTKGGEFIPKPKLPEEKESEI